MSEAATHDAIEAVARDSYGRLLAYIASRSGDIADAQDALSESGCRSGNLAEEWSSR
jgi:hypothetical protein